MHDRLIVDCFTICKREKTCASDLEILVPAALEKRADLETSEFLNRRCLLLSLDCSWLFATVGCCFEGLDRGASSWCSGLLIWSDQSGRDRRPAGPYPLSDNSIPPVKPDGVQAKGMNYTL